MNDPVYTSADYLKAELILDHLGQQLAIEFQLHGEEFDRETMQLHTRKRAAINAVREMLLDECERIL